jgi:hypothetical protein
MISGIHIEARSALKEQRAALLRIPGATSLALGRKDGMDAVVVFVKGNIAEARAAAETLQTELGVAIVIMQEHTVM